MTLRFIDPPARIRDASSQQCWHMAHAACQALDEDFDNISPKELFDKIASLRRWQDEVMKVANRVFSLDGCCHWETICDRIENAKT